MLVRYLKENQTSENIRGKRKRVENNDDNSGRRKLHRKETEF